MPRSPRPSRPSRRHHSGSSQRGGPEARAGVGDAGGHAPPLGDAARDLAIRRIAAQARRYPDFALMDLDTGALPPRDAAFAHAIYDAVIRRWLTLAYLVDSRLDKGLEDLEPKVTAVLMAGAAQLLLMDRVPPHAAINHAAEWAKRVIRPGAAGLVNAVLRRVAALRTDAPRREGWTDQRDELPMADGSALVLSEAVMPKAPLERLAIATSTAEQVLEGWSRTMPEEDVRALALHGLSTPPVVLNTAHATAPLPGPPLLEPHSVAGHHVFGGTHAELLELLGSRDDLWVQDPASSQPVALAAGLRPRLIVDLCAGLGTKTRQLAAVFPEASIIATDVDPTRFKTLQSVFHGHPRVQVLPAAGVADRARGVADLVLVDVPCSNSGVLARRPEAKYRFDGGRQGSLVAVQRKILTEAAALATDSPSRGAILYSTCSIEPEENEDQAAWAEGELGRARVREQRRTPSGGPGQPPHLYTDASYAALLA